MSGFLYPEFWSSGINDPKSGTRSRLSLAGIPAAIFFLSLLNSPATNNFPPMRRGDGGWANKDFFFLGTQPKKKPIPGWMAQTPGLVRATTWADFTVICVCVALFYWPEGEEVETRPPVALGSSPELFAFAMSLAPPVHPWWSTLITWNKGLFQRILRTWHDMRSKNV